MFGFKSWNYAERLVSGEIDETTNNGSESLNAVFNRHSQAGFKGFKGVVNIFQRFLKVAFLYLRIRVLS